MYWLCPFVTGLGSKPICLIETWLRGGLEIGGRRQRVKPGVIAMLYPGAVRMRLRRTLCDRLNGFTRGGAAGRGRIFTASSRSVSAACPDRFM